MLSLASCMISMFDGNASHIYDFDVPSENLNLQVYFDGEMNVFDDEFAIEHKHIQPKKHVDVHNSDRNIYSSLLLPLFSYDFDLNLFSSLCFCTYAEFST